MASRLKTTITGRQAVLQALRALGDGADPIALDAVRAGGEVFKAEVVRRAPVGDGKKRPAGTMRSKIKNKVFTKKGYAQSAVNVPPESVFTEYGFLHRRSGKRIAARPWIRPSFEAQAGPVEKTVLERMARDVEAAARRGANPDA